MPHRRTFVPFLVPLFLLAAPPLRAAPARESPARESPAVRGATVNGYVRDAESGETLVFASVRIRELDAGTTTNKSGFFSLAGVPPGAYTLVASYLGYRNDERRISLAEGQTLTLAIRLAPEAVRIDSVTVEGTRENDRREIDVSRVNVPAAQIEHLRIGGEPDVFRALQYLPGILASSQISSGLYIRGGSPDQTLVLLDGSTVYNPSHLFGFFSTFNPDAIKDVDLIKGGYPAEYGGRMSAVLDLTQMDGNRNAFEGTASLGLISSRLTLQGPVGNGSWFLGGRRTYVDLITGLLETPDNPLPNYHFIDGNGKISQDLGPSDKIFLSAFAGQDRLAYDNRAGFVGDIGIDNASVAARWTHLFGDNVFSWFNLSWSRYRNGFRADLAGFQTEVGNGIQDYTAKGNLEWLPNSDVTVKTGFEASHYIFDFSTNFSGDTGKKTGKGTNEGGVINLEVPDEAVSAFAQANVFLTSRFSVQSGLRANAYAMRRLLTWDPRLAIRYRLDGPVALTAAWGIYHQYFRLATLPDFSFFDTWFPADSTVDPGRAIQYVAGIETTPLPGVDVSLEGYYKTLAHLGEFNQRATEAHNVIDLFFDGRGEAYGVELFAQKKTGRLTGWIGYALGFTNERFAEINDGRWFRPRWDRRHDLKIVATYRLDARWEFGATFTFQSGQSYTGMTSRVESVLPGENVGVGMTIPAERYGLRLPPSHQLNVSANYSTTLFDHPMRILLDVFNVYSRRDIWFRYYDTRGPVATVTDIRLLPILPSLAVELQF